MPPPISSPSVRSHNNDARAPKLLDRVRWHLRLKHYSIRTEQAYTDWYLPTRGAANGVATTSVKRICKTRSSWRPGSAVIAKAASCHTFRHSFATHLL